jgi:periplasmic divalent cation tolerance protein
MDSYIVIFTTCANAAEAERIAQALVTGRLAACVQILPAIRSIYLWQSKVESAEEHLLFIKTSQVRFEAVRLKIEELHSYEVPEVIALPITAGAGKYLAWLGAIVDD